MEAFSACCRRTYSTAAAVAHAEFRLAIVTWIETTYRWRRQQGLIRLTPIEFETRLNTTRTV
jgi:putative transposase